MWSGSDRVTVLLANINFMICLYFRSIRFSERQRTYLSRFENIIALSSHINSTGSMCLLSCLVSIVYLVQFSMRSRCGSGQTTQPIYLRDKHLFVCLVEYISLSPCGDVLFQHDDADLMAVDMKESLEFVLLSVILRQ